MPKPESKQELLESIHHERQLLEKSFRDLSDTDMTLPGACGNWSVKDILAHLVDWEQRGLSWYRAGLRGEVPKPPDEHFNWGQLPALNHAIYLQHKDQSLSDILHQFQISFQENMAAIHAMTEEELYAPNFYPWTGKHTLGTYVNANTAAHYRWGCKLIKKFTRSLKQSSEQ
jgi:hypothetical protein